MNFIELADLLDREAGEMRAVAKRLRSLGVTLGDKLRGLGLEVVAANGAPTMPERRKRGPVGPRAAVEERYLAVVRAIAGGANTSADIRRAVAHAGIRIEDSVWGSTIAKLQERGLVANKGGPAVHARFEATAKGKALLAEPATA